MIHRALLNRETRLNHEKVVCSHVRPQKHQISLKPTFVFYKAVGLRKAQVKEILSSFLVHLYWEELHGNVEARRLRTCNSEPILEIGAKQSRCFQTEYDLKIETGKKRALLHSTRAPWTTTCSSAYHAVFGPFPCQFRINYSGHKLLRPKSLNQVFFLKPEGSICVLQKKNQMKPAPKLPTLRPIVFYSVLICFQFLCR